MLKEYPEMEGFVATRNSFLMDSFTLDPSREEREKTRNSFLMDSDYLYTPGFI